MPATSISISTILLLIVSIGLHGYYEDKSVWKDLQNLFQNKTRQKLLLLHLIPQMTNVDLLQTMPKNWDKL